MLHEIVRDTTRKSVKHELIRVGAQTMSVVSHVVYTFFLSNSVVIRICGPNFFNFSVWVKAYS